MSETWPHSSISISVRAVTSAVRWDRANPPAALTNPDVLVPLRLPPSWQLCLFHRWTKACACCRVASAEKAKWGKRGCRLCAFIFHPTAWCAHRQLWQRNGLGTGSAGPRQTAARTGHSFLSYLGDADAQRSSSASSANPNFALADEKSFTLWGWKSHLLLIYAWEVSVPFHWLQRGSVRAWKDTEEPRVLRKWVTKALQTWKGKS